MSKMEKPELKKLNLESTHAEDCNCNYGSEEVVAAEGKCLHYCHQREWIHLIPDSWTKNHYKSTTCTEHDDCCCHKVVDTNTNS